MEMLEIILQEVRQIRADLNAHIRDEDKTQNEIREDVHALRTQVALNKQQGSAIIAGISTVISAATAWFVAHFGGRI